MSNSFTQNTGSTSVLTTKTNSSGITTVDSNSLAALNASGLNTNSLYRLLLSAQQSVKGRNPFDFPSTTTQPLVSSVQLNQSAFSNPVNHYYNDTGGFDTFRMIGIPYGDTTLCGNINSNTFNIQNPIGPSGSGPYGMQTAQSMRGTNYVEFKVTCSSLQIVPYIGLSSDYAPIYVNGIGVGPASSGNVSSNIQVNFATRGTYDLLVGFEQSSVVSNIILDGDDTLHAVTQKRLPVVYFGDSYGLGTTSPQINGGIGITGALSLIGGINCISHSATGTGYVNDGGNGFPFTLTARLQFVAALVNASNAPLIIVPASWNDVNAAATTSAMQTAATTIANYLLSNTKANIVMLGAYPANRNNSLAQQTVDTGVSNAVTAIGNNRLAFQPIAGASPPWITGTRSTSSTTGGTTGNSRYLTGTDNIHPSPFFTAVQPLPANSTPSSGVEYLARKILDAVTTISLNRSW